MNLASQRQEGDKTLSENSVYLRGAKQLLQSSGGSLGKEWLSQLDDIGANLDQKQFWQELIQYGLRLKAAGHADKAEQLFQWVQLQTPYKDATDKAAKEIKNPGWDQVLRDTVFSIGPNDLVDLAIFHAANRFGNVAKIAGLKFFRKRNLTSFPFVLAARSVGVWSEGSMIWGLSTLYQNARKGFKEPVDSYALFKSAMAVQFMMRGIRVFGVVAYETTPRLARAMGMVQPNGVLTRGGNFLVKTATHGASMAGMLTVLNATREYGLIPHQPGGSRQEFVRDIFSYIKYAVASNGFSRLFGKRYHTSTENEFREILRLESQMKSETYLKKIGFKVAARQPDGLARFDQKSPVLEGLLPKLNLVEKSGAVVDWAHNILVQMTQFQVARPGFDGTKVFRLLEKGGPNAANTYCSRFGLKIHLNENGGFDISETGVENLAQPR